MVHSFRRTPLALAIHWRYRNYTLTTYTSTQHPADRSVSKNVDAAVILEHSGQEYIRHSSLQDFDFTKDFLGKRNIIGEGSDKLTQNTPMEFKDIQAVIYRDGDGKIITLGTDSTGGGLTQRQQVEQLIAEIDISDLADTPE